VALAQEQRDRALGGDEVEAAQVGDASRVEDRQGVDAGGVEPGADRFPAPRKLGRRDLRRVQ
jgi:hypothetical protein